MNGPTTAVLITLAILAMLLLGGYRLSRALNKAKRRVRREQRKDLSEADR